MRVGYARVSTIDQNLEGQIDALHSDGCKPIVSEKISSRKERPKLEEAIGWLDKGDIFVCTRMDRLARSMRDLINILDRLNEKGVDVVFLEQKIDTSSAGGKLVFHLFASVAEFERDIIKERTRRGLKAARARGRVGGRKKLLSPVKVKALYEMYDSKNYSISQICETLGLKKRTMYDYIDRRKSCENREYS